MPSKSSFSIVFRWNICYNYKGKRLFVEGLQSSFPKIQTFYNFSLESGDIAMRLRRLEFAIISVTLAFVCFMGGFFTGRSWNSVNITAVATQNGGSHGVGLSISSPGQIEQEIPAAPDTSHSAGDLSPGAGDTANSNGVTQTGKIPETAGAPRDGDGKININLAAQSELMDLPGIGSVLASRIVDYRRQHGAFTSIEDIRSVSGIGEKRYDTIKDKITVG